MEPSLMRLRAVTGGWGVNYLWDTNISPGFDAIHVLSTHINTNGGAAGYAALTCQFTVPNNAWPRPLASVTARFNYITMGTAGVVGDWSAETYIGLWGDLESTNQSIVTAATFTVLPDDGVLYTHHSVQTAAMPIGFTALPSGNFNTGILYTTITRPFANNGQMEILGVTLMWLPG